MKNTLKSKKRLVQEYKVFGIGLLFLFVFISSFSNKKNSIMTKAAQNSVIAHRGAWKHAGLPQNSIASLRQAITLGCIGSEFDVRMTADGQLVVNHDQEFGGLDIEKTNYKDLLVHKLSNGEQIPTLEEYIRAGMENNPNTRLVCEIKPSEISKERGVLIAEETVNLVRSLKGESMVNYISFDYDILKKIKEIEPGAQVQFLNGDKSPKTIRKDGMEGIDYHYLVFRALPKWVKQAKKEGIILNTWTVNDPEMMDWFLKKEFDFITTDEPELLLQKQKSLWTEGNS